MKLTVCEGCKKPFLSEKTRCPDCSCPYGFDHNSTILIAAIAIVFLPIVGLLAAWFFYFFKNVMP